MHGKISQTATGSNTMEKTWMTLYLFEKKRDLNIISSDTLKIFK